MLALFRLELKNNMGDRRGAAAQSKSDIYSIPAGLLGREARLPGFAAVMVWAQASQQSHIQD